MQDQHVKGKDFGGCCKPFQDLWQNPVRTSYHAQVVSMNSSSQIVCSGLWQWLQSTGLERFELVRAADDLDLSWNHPDSDR